MHPAKVETSAPLLHDDSIFLPEFKVYRECNGNRLSKDIVINLHFLFADLLDF